jgi:hypothetical protein
MAVARLSGAWILEILRTNYQEGVLRRALLDQFATLLVSPRSTPGAKGRVARRLYSKLAMLQRRGAIAVEEGVVRPLMVDKNWTKNLTLPVMGPLLRKKQFLVLMAEDRSPEGTNGEELRNLRWDFLSAAIEAGWILAQAASAIGLAPGKAAQIIAKPKGSGPRIP